MSRTVFDFRCELTSEDVAFVSLARQHYRIFAEPCEKRGDANTAGKMRSQEFYAERMLERIVEAAESQGAPPELRRIVYQPLGSADPRT